MMTYTLNNEKKALKELKLDELDLVTGGDMKLYKKDGDYYIYSPELGGEMTCHDFGVLLWGIYDTFGPDVTIDFLQQIDPNPHAEELIRVYKPWGVVTHYQSRIDGTNNGWTIGGSK